MIPNSIEEAVEILSTKLTKKDIEGIDSEEVHHTYGREIRNSWSLWDRNGNLKRNAKQNYGLSHADDISGLILAWTFARIRGQEFDPQEHTNLYKDYWKSIGQDPGAF